MRLLVFIFGCIQSLCPDYEVGAKCVNKCDNQKSECRDNCEDNPLCDFECSVELDACIQSCPCFFECLDGCVDCPNAVCTCADPHQNDDYISCVAWVESVYVDCLFGCSFGDPHCLSVCGYNYARMMDECPCTVRSLVFCTDN